jgi:CHAD domain-containing protein
VRKTVEREQKWVPDDGFRLADLGEPATRVFSSTYHDTPDLRLACHGITLRRRVEDGSRLWQLKIPTADARAELESPGSSDSPPAELTRLLAVHLRDETLGPVARLRTRRRSVHRNGAEIVEDAVSVFEGRRVVKRFREVEVELTDGDERSLGKVARLLRRAGAEPGELVPKLFVALDLAREPEPAPLPPDATAGEALGRALTDQHRRLIDHDPGTRLGVDPEDLHQLRVATRRARAFLRAAQGLVEPEWADGLQVELRWLGSLLGPARDADVLLEHMTDAVAALDDEAFASSLLRALERERTRARRAAVRALSRKRYFALLDRLAEAGRPPLVAGDVRLADLWWQEVKRARRSFGKLDGGSEDDELHAARIRVKRARYAAELASHELGAPGERFVAATKELQDVLGAHQDSVVAEEWVVRFGDTAPGSEELVARLVRGERRRRKRARRAWPEAWERVARRARRARP